MMKSAYGIYEALLDEHLRDLLASQPELRTIFGKIDHEEQPSVYAGFVAKILEQVLRETSNPNARFELCNQLFRATDHRP